VEYGVSLEAVAEAYDHLFSGKVPIVELGTEINLAKFKRMAHKICHSAESVPSTASFCVHDISFEECSGCVLLCSKPGDDEATAAAGIMMRIIGQQIFCKTGARMISSVEETGLCNDNQLWRCAINARCVIVLLSQGSLESEEQLKVIAEAMLQHRQVDFPVVVPVHLPGFQFPSEHYFKEVLPTVWPDSNTDMRSHLEEFFNRISLRLSTDASEMELATQAQRVLDRIPENFHSCVGLAEDVGG